MHPSRDRRSARRAEPDDATRQSDQALDRALRLRRRQRLDALAEPDFPASGTERIAARVAEAKARDRSARRP